MSTQTPITSTNDGLVRDPFGNIIIDNGFDLRKKHGWMALRNNVHMQSLSSTSFINAVSATLIGEIKTNFDMIKNDVRSMFRVTDSDSAVLLMQGMFRGSATVLAEGQSPPLTAPSYFHVHSTPYLIGIASQVTYQQARDSDIGILNEISKFVPRAFSEAEGRIITEIAFSGVADGSSDFKSGQVYSSHLLLADDANWTTAGKMDVEKWTTAKLILEEEGYKMTHVIMHPTQAAQLARVPEFYGSSRYAGLTPEASAQISSPELKPLGIPNDVKLFVTRFAPKDKIICYDGAEYGVFAETDPIYSFNEQSLTGLLTNAYYERILSAVYQPQAGVRIDNLTTVNVASYQS